MKSRRKFIITEFEVDNKETPTGTNIIPITPKIATTFSGVRMGCQAAMRCCLNGVSTSEIR
jgi:hypothetical protein